MIKLKLTTFLLFFVFACLSIQAHAVTLKIATLSPDGSTWMKKFREGAEEIAAKTNNRVRFKFYPGGVMGQDKAVLRKMRIGQLHGGAFSNGSLNEIFPGVQVYNLVMKFKSYEEVDYVRSKMDRQIQQGLEANGMVVLGLSELGFAYLMSTQPVHSLADLRRQKVWIPENNFVATQALNAFSVTPIPLPMRDVLIALQTSMINTVAGSAIGAITLQWHTKVKYLTKLPLSYIYGILVLSEKAFKKISAKDQQIVREVMWRVSTELDKLNRKDNLDAMEAIRNQGIEIITPKQEAVGELKLLVKTANRNLMSAGEMNPDIVNTLDKHLADFRSSVAVVKE